MKLRAFTFLLPALLSAADTAPTRLGQGINAYNVKDYPGAIQQLRGLQTQLPKLTDYVVYHLASSELQTGDIDGAVRDLTAYRGQPAPASPLAGKISLLHARALLDLKQPAASTKALDILQTDYRLLPQPDGDFALAMAYEALGEKLQSALTYEKVYYGFPNTDLAAQASAVMDRLRTVLNRDFPLAPPRQQLERCQKWLDVKEFGKARQEYTVLASTLPEPDRDQAKVGIGAADYLAGDAPSALRYLTGLKVARSEADARRLYFMTEAAKKTGDDTAMAESIRLLNRQYAESPWRLKALLAAGNRYVATSEREKYAPLFKAASDSFPADSATAAGHWRIAWDAYLAGTPDRPDLLREQAERYPSDSRAGTALYFLGRLEEKNGRLPQARAYYERLSQQFPHYFYAVLARERIKDAKLAAAAPEPATVEWLTSIDWPEHRDFTSTVPNAATRLRIDRARLLMLAGLPDVADAELRFGAKTQDEQPHLLAMELARSMPTPFHALRIMKSFSADYLALPFDKAPLKFWQMLFPLPYKEDVVRNSKSHDLDPYSVAALIRQETEFNPAAHSPANAYGLMQLVPATGRQMARQQGIRLAGTNTLLDPSISIQLGTHYLREQLNNWGGDWVQTLAAYNAGPGRVRQWLASIAYKEPAEFVESIPFNETREYVQAVLRNADMYRTIYGERHLQALDARDVSEVPPVNLSSLPLAARTPGGGLKKQPAAPPAAHHKVIAKGSAKSRVVAGKAGAKKSGAATKSAAARPAPSKTNTGKTTAAKGASVKKRPPA
ncbi:MAG: transglycosylase SLT domain-containing protein [Acidobacteriota bacterium]